MRTRVLQLIMFLVLGLFPGWSFAEGPESGGGGGVVVEQGMYHLLDFYNTNANLDFLNSIYIEKPSRLSSQVKIKLSQVADAELQSSGLQSPVAHLLSLLNRWGSIPFDSEAYRIKWALQSNLSFDFTNEEIAKAEHFKPKFLKNQLSVITAAYYQTKGQNYNVYIAKDLWNKLSLRDQTALLLHETLRHIQLGYKFKFNDEALQKVTTLMIVCKPQIKLSQYLFYLIMGRSDLAERYIGAYDDIIKSCAADGI